jgi:hypothetical protein
MENYVEEDKMVQANIDNRRNSMFSDGRSSLQKPSSYSCNL